MKKQLLVSLVVLIGILAGSASAQEVTIHHGFLFFASEKYTMDQGTYGIYEDGHEFKELLKDNPKALSKFKSYQGWHTTALVSTGLSLAAFVFGGFCYMDAVNKEIPEGTGVIALASGGGLLALGFIFEFISYGSISGAAETYNKGLMDDESSATFDPVPSTAIALLPGGGQFALTWRF